MTAPGTKRTKLNPGREVRNGRLSRHLAYADKARYTDAFDSRVCCMISGTVLPTFLSFLTCWMISATRRGLRPKRVHRSRAFLMPSICRSRRMSFSQLHLELWHDELRS